MTSLARLAAALLIPATTLTAACGPQEPAQTPTPSAASARVQPSPPSDLPKIVLGTGPDEKAIDASVSPCGDFYAYACGTWNKSTPIPEDQATWMRSFSVISEENEKLLRGILENYSTAASTDPFGRALGDFYTACMDEAGIEKAGASVLDPELKAIDSFKTTADLPKLLAKLHLRGIPPLFNFSSQQDFKDSSQVIGSFDQGGLGLPEREYYLSDNAKMKEIRYKYEEHIARMLELSGLTARVAKQGAAAVIHVETELAKVSMTKEDLRKPEKIYHRLELDGLAKAAPAVDWKSYLSELGFGNVTTLNVSQPDFFTALSAMLPTKATAAKPNSQTGPAPLPIPELKAYLRWHTLRATASRLPARFVDEAFRFRSSLTGAQKNLPRWKRCVRATDAALGEALARPFVAKTLGEEGKRNALEMIGGIEGAMKANLAGLVWMDSTTRNKALEKLEAIANKIGYPNKWRDYAALERDIDRKSYLKNVLAAETFEVKRQLAKIGKPVDRTEWLMTPPSVNAYYDPTMNEMVFPAGILQPPFYANKASLSVNFGGIGMVMGHELTHGFDDEGRKFDAKGNMTDWWSASVGKEFDRRASCVEKQFAGYVAIDDLKVNGELTLGENIADLGGVKLAYHAMKQALEGKQVQSASKFTPAQQFFLGYAQSWCGNYRPEAMRLLVNTNPHSPPKLRVNGPVSNLTEFAEAFSCKAGDAMVRAPDVRCEVW